MHPLPRIGLLAALAIVWSGAAAAEVERKPGCFTGFWDRRAETPVPAGFDEDVVRQGLGITGELCGFAVEPWGRDGRLYVAVAEQPDTLSIGVFEKDASIRLRARSRTSFEHYARAHFLDFDFAPYRISPEETAIGIRLAKPIAYAGGGGRCDSISLFRLHGDRLDLVLYAQIDYEAMVRGDPIEPGGPSVVHDVEAKATLAVAPEQTSGFFDYVRTVKLSSFMDDRAGWQSRYAWSDGRYRPVGAPEVLEENCVIHGFDHRPDEAEGEGFPAWVAY